MDSHININKVKYTNIAIVCFFSLYIILPDYFAIEFSETLPLITASRFLVVFLFVIVLIKDNFRISLHDLGRDYVIFLLVMIVINLINITSLPAESIKTVLSVMFESWMMVYCIVRLLQSKKAIDLAITAMVIASIIVAVAGIIETFTAKNIFYFLITTDRERLQTTYYRLGSVRASGPFGHAIYYGTYNLLMVPFSLYLYDTKKKNIYFFVCLLNILSVILSGSRGQIAILGLLLCYIIIKKRLLTKIIYIKKLLFLIPVLLFSILLFPDLFSRMLALIDSTIRVFGYSGDRTTDALGNANGLLSRFEQWSGIVWTIKNGKFWFGFGNKCHLAFLIKYYRDGLWVRTSTFDVGYVAIFCQYGIVGVLAFFELYYTRIKMIIQSEKNILKNNDFKNLSVTFMTFYITYLINLLTCTGVDKLLYVIIALQIAFININKKQC